jgi:hypothetical protein
MGSAGLSRCRLSIRLIDSTPRRRVIDVVFADGYLSADAFSAGALAAPANLAGLPRSRAHRIWNGLV